MKKLNLALTIILFSMLSGMAQELPRGFNFQAVARNDDGSPKANTSVQVVFGIFPDETSIIPLYKEIHMVSTDQFGVFSATVGGGSPQTGNFSTLHFQDYDCELAVWQIDGGTEVEITRTRLLSVPYAKSSLHAADADTAVYATQAFFPAGMIIPFAGPPENIPAGWMLCDGSTISRTGYPGLFSAIGTAWGSGDGSTTFNIPDLRGVFLRGVDNTRNLDPDKDARTESNSGGNTGNNVGSFQLDMFRIHLHYLHDAYYSESSPKGNIMGSNSTDYDNSYQFYYHNTTSAGGNETRPVNAYVNYIIKL